MKQLASRQSLVQKSTIPSTHTRQRVPLVCVSTPQHMSHYDETVPYITIVERKANRAIHSLVMSKFITHKLYEAEIITWCNTCQDLAQCLGSASGVRLPA
jgi:hypothetical protein